jgi:hypothetical protein
MKTIFNDGILEAKLMPSQWVFCRWVDNKHGRLQKRLIKDLNDIERFIYAKKLRGWFAESEINHSNFHKLLIKFGCLPREVIGEYLRFMKPIRNVGDLHQKVGGEHVRV